MRIFRRYDVFIFRSSLYDLGVSSYISYFWNFGSLLGLCLALQVFSGLFLSFHYVSFVEESFFRVVHIVRDVPFGFLFRSLHSNGASFFFFFIYLHIARGLYYGSFRLSSVWGTGVFIYLLLIGVAFLGYVLPWGQMSYWGATVITNLISVIPYLGEYFVKWVWGGFSVGGSTLTRFFSFHFLFPFILSFLVLFHLFFLHNYGSSSYSSLDSWLDKIPFFSYYGVRDFLGFFVFLIVFLFFVFIFPFSLGDPENFAEADPLRTPLHIQPEWYFLFAYAILRSVPRKLGGVVFLLLSIFILYFLVFFSFEWSCQFFFRRFFFFFFSGRFFILTWIGICVVEYPFDLVGAFFSFFYFCSFFFFFL